MEVNSNPIIKSLCVEIQKGIDLIDRIGKDTYNAAPDGGASVGAHFRHNFDFFVNLLNGIRTGRFNYSSRDRDLRIETDDKYAVRMFRELIEEISTIEIADSLETYTVLSEVDSNIQFSTSAYRELEFVHSHTVHHYAIIAMKLKSLGESLDKEFGVAPSTLQFWNAKSLNAASA